ncbi:MAG TPA: FecR domain-containing protein [Opitutaceae bacterium]
MSAPDSSLADLAIQAAAARWTVDRDRGLSAAESVEFELWLAADPRHAAAMRRSAGAWSMLDRVPDLAAQRELLALRHQRARRRRMVFFSSLAAAAVLAVAAFGWWRTASARLSPEVAPALVAAGPREVVLADGTAVKLNAGSEIVEEYEPAERRVRLTRGEAHFVVTKDKARPFIVVAGGVRVRAVGTAFNVNFQSSRVEVLVTEGAVRVATPLAASSDPAATPAQPELRAGEYAVVETPSLTTGTQSQAHTPTPVIVVTRLDPAAISKTLAWHENVVRLGGATLAELAAEFERRFGQTVRFAEPDIAQQRAGGRVPGDDPEAVARLLATTFDLEVERAADGAWVMRKKKSDSR